MSINIHSDFLRCDENLQIYYNLFVPDNVELKASLIIVHGMQEHSGRYADFANFMASKGFAVLTFDLPGHGKTAKNESELGFFRKNKPHELLIDCTQSMAEYIHAKHPKLPHFILAHSMGSFIARCLLHKAPTLFDAAVLSGTACKANTAPLGRIYFALRNAINANRRTGFNNIFKAMNNNSFKNEADNDGIAWLSVDKANRKAFQNDELCGVDFSNNGFYALLSLNILANKSNWTKSLSPNFPIILMSGAYDPIGDFSVGVKKVFENMQKNGMKNVEMKIFPDLRHEILQETCKLDVYEQINLWLNKQI